MHALNAYEWSAVLKTGPYRKTDFRHTPTVQGAKTLNNLQAASGQISPFD